MAIALPIKLTDGPGSISAVVSCSDSCRLVVTDSAAVLVSFAVADGSSITLSELSSAVATLLVTDSTRIAGSETSSVIDPNTASISASDTVTVILFDESTTVSSTSTVQDTPSIGISDSVNTLQVFTGQSTNNVSVSDSLTVRLNGIEPPAPTISVSVTDVFSGLLADVVTFTVSAVSSDTLAIRGTDAAATPVVTVRVPDSLSVSVTEPGDQQSSLGVIESFTVQGSDAAPLISGSFSFNVTDSVTVQQTDATSFGAVAVGSGDSCKVTSSETLTNSASVSAVESLRATLAEVTAAFKDMSAGDSLSVQLTDTASPIFNSFIDISASDSCAVQASESISELISFLSQLTVSDSLLVGEADGIAEAFVNLVASDNVPVSTDGLASIFDDVSTSDTLKVGTIEQGLAIP